MSPCGNGAGENAPAQADLGTQSTAPIESEMGTRVIIDRATDDQLRIELRQSTGEVVQFAVFVVAVVGAWFALMPQARTAPGWLLALLAIAGAWSVIALTAREVYVIDTVAGRVDATRSSLLGRRNQSFTVREVVAVRLRIGGADDNRRLVELFTNAGVVLTGMPWRLTTLTESAQSEIGHAIADCLGVRLRDETRWRV